jgi:hypothetical protein
MVANGGAVMEPVCACESRRRWSISLTIQKLMNQDAACQLNVSAVARLGPVPAVVEALPAPTPAAAPPTSPSAAASKEPHHEEQQYRTDGSVDDCTDHAGTEMDAKLRQQPTSDKGAQNPHNEVTNDPKSGPSHDLACQPACDETHKQYDQQAFTRLPTRKNCSLWR